MLLGWLFQSNCKMTAEGGNTFYGGALPRSLQIFLHKRSGDRVTSRHEAHFLISAAGRGLGIGTIHLQGLYESIAEIL